MENLREKMKDSCDEIINDIENKISSIVDNLEKIKGVYEVDEAVSDLKSLIDSLY